MDLRIGFEHALENEQLIHGVLKRLHIYRDSVNYQDYVQEAMIIYARSYVDYLANKQDLDCFNKYIFQKLVWRMTDLLRKEQKFGDVHSLEVFDFERVEQTERIDLFEEIDLSCLSELEKRLFYDTFIAEIPLKILAEKYHCSARNLRYHRNSIKEKLCKRLS